MNANCNAVLQNGEASKFIYFDTEQLSVGGNATSARPANIYFPTERPLPEHAPDKKIVSATLGSLDPLAHLPAAYRQCLLDLDALTRTELRKKYQTEYSTLINTKTRCKKRGYVLHPEFRDFKGFLRAVGPKPDRSYTLDRKNPDDVEYAPGKVEWASKLRQSANRRTRRVVSYFGLDLSITEWSRRTGIPADTIRARLNRGWDAKRALTELPRWAQPVKSVVPGWDTEIQQVWARVMNEQSKVGPFIFAGRDYACIKRMARRFNYDYYLKQSGLDAIELVLRQWDSFRMFLHHSTVKHAKSPARPTTAFVLDHLFAVKEFYFEQQDNAGFPDVADAPMS